MRLNSACGGGACAVWLPGDCLQPPAAAESGAPRPALRRSHAPSCNSCVPRLALATPSSPTLLVCCMMYLTVTTAGRTPRPPTTSWCTLPRRRLITFGTASGLGSRAPRRRRPSDARGRPAASRAPGLPWASFHAVGGGRGMRHARPLQRKCSRGLRAGWDCTPLAMQGRQHSCSICLAVTPLAAEHALSL